MSTALPELSDLFNDVLGRVQGREPRKREWETPGGWLIGWSTERMGNGKFGAYAYRPMGPGSRSGADAQLAHMRKGHAIRMHLQREAYRAARWRAKRKAFQWYLAQLRREAASGKPFAAKAQRELDRWKGVEVAQGGAFRRRTEPEG